MTVLICLLVAAVLIFVPRGPIILEARKLPGGYDNNHPREKVKDLSPLGKRAVAAHQNSFEAFTLFAPGALLCEMRHVNATYAAALAIAFVVIRCVYIALYLGNKATARSGVWSLGVLATLGLYVIAIFQI
jgi:uncharacterized MAPEG superfamily protein